MAFVYNQNDIQNSDMVDPEDFNSNMRELAGEFNGKLDRDNFKENVFGPDQIASTAFNRVYSQVALNKWTLDAESTTFQNGLSYVEFESGYEGMLICEWSGSVYFKNPPSKDNTDPDNAQILTIHMMVNGSVVGRVFRVSGGRYRVPLYMVGAIPVSPGRIKVEVSAMTAEMEHTKGDESC